MIEKKNELKRMGAELKRKESELRQKEEQQAVKEAQQNNKEARLNNKEEEITRRKTICSKGHRLNPTTLSALKKKFLEFPIHMQDMFAISFWRPQILAL